MPKESYEDIVKENSLRGRIARSVLKYRLASRGKITAGINVAGYIVVDNRTGKQVGIFVGSSTGEGTASNTHPDQKCLNDMVEKLRDREYLTKTIYESHRFCNATTYKDQLKSKIYPKTEGSEPDLQIIFFSERGPCVGNATSCTPHLTSILGDTFLRENTFFAVDYQERPVNHPKGKKSPMQEEFEAELEAARGVYDTLGELFASDEAAKEKEEKAVEKVKASSSSSSSSSAKSSPDSSSSFSSSAEPSFDPSPTAGLPKTGIHAPFKRPAQESTEEVKSKEKLPHKPDLVADPSATTKDRPGEEADEDVEEQLAIHASLDSSVKPPSSSSSSSSFSGRPPSSSSSSSSFSGRPPSSSSSSSSFSVRPPSSSSSSSSFSGRPPSSSSSSSSFSGRPSSSSSSSSSFSGRPPSSSSSSSSFSGRPPSSSSSSSSFSGRPPSSSSSSSSFGAGPRPLSTTPQFDNLSRQERARRVNAERARAAAASKSTDKKAKFNPGKKSSDNDSSD